MKSKMILSISSSLWIALLVDRTLASSNTVQITYKVNQGRADAVKEAFQFAWKGYQKYAFPHDELHPVDNGFSDSRNGWGASAVDALSTAIVMELPDVTQTIIDYIPSINYGYSSDSVSLFETTIRYLGGMLAGYDLLTGPFSGLTSNTSAVQALLSQSKRLADNLSFAFDTPSGIPDNSILLSTRSLGGDTTNGLATIGTLVLEWTRLSDLTNNRTYAKLVQKAESYLLNPKPASGQPFPGLLGTDVYLSNGEFSDSYGGWVGGDDSFYEYLIKMYVYDRNGFASYKDRWVAAADSSIQYLASNPSTAKNLTFLAQFNNKQLIYDSQHLACFAGGNFLLGGLVLGEQKYIDFGLSLAAGCHQTYAATATGIGPESFEWIPSTCTGTCSVPSAYANQGSFYQKSGFYITDSVYDLRPEVLESIYYAYRITGDPKYQDWAWEAFLAINATCRVGSGFSAINDVNTPGGGGFLNNQESFFFAEVMKYAYLIQSADGPWQVNHGGNGANQFVFNTEAHPLRVRR